jgi:hypothetical protein
MPVILATIKKTAKRIRCIGYRPLNSAHNIGNRNATLAHTLNHYFLVRHSQGGIGCESVQRPDSLLVFRFQYSLAFVRLSAYFLQNLQVYGQSPRHIRRD